MSWCDIHQTGFEYCKGRHGMVDNQPAPDQMSFGDFERVMSIIEKATEKDIADLHEMIGRRQIVLKMLKEKKEATGNA